MTIINVKARTGSLTGSFRIRGNPNRINRTPRPMESMKYRIIRTTTEPADANPPEDKAKAEKKERIKTARALNTIAEPKSATPSRDSSYAERGDFLPRRQNGEDTREQPDRPHPEIVKPNAM